MSEEKIFNVTSDNQSGGITAGIVNIFHKLRIELTDENKKQLIENLNDKSATIHVSLQSGGGSEVAGLSQEIMSFLLESGYKNILGVHTIMGFAPFKGMTIERKTESELVIFIGSLI